MQARERRPGARPTLPLSRDSSTREARRQPRLLERCSRQFPLALRRAALADACGFFLLVLVLGTLAFLAARIQFGHVGDVAGCLGSIGNARTLVICDPNAFNCESLAELPIKFVVATSQNLSEPTLSAAMTALVVGTPTLTDIVFIGDVTRLAPAAAAILSRVPPHGLVATALTTAPASSAATDRLFSRVLGLTDVGSGALSGWQISSSLQPAPVPAFQARHRAPHETVRVMRLLSPGQRPSGALLRLPSAEVDTVAVLIDSLSGGGAAPPGSLVLQGHRSNSGGEPLPPGQRLLEWYWPRDRSALAESLAYYDAILCGDGCVALDVAPLLELAAAVAVPVLLGTSAPPLQLKGTRLAGFPFFGNASLKLAQAIPASVGSPRGEGASDALMLAVSLARMQTAPAWEAHLLLCRRWLEARRESSLAAWAQVLHAGAGVWPTAQLPPPPLSPAASPLGIVPPAHGSAIALVVSELAPVNSGGAGVVAAATALSLLWSGFDVVVVGHFACRDVASWDGWAREQLASSATMAAAGFAPPRGRSVGRLTSLCLTGLLAEQQGERGTRARAMINAQRNPYVRAAIETAVGLEAAYGRVPFGAVELFDFNGPAAELLRARVDSDAHPYIPSHVRVLVRVHGTMGAIDEIEVPQPARLSRWVAVRHRLEQYALEAADSVLLQSVPVKELFARAYQLRPGAAVLAPPPMSSISALFVRRTQSYAEEALCLRQADALPLPCAAAMGRRGVNGAASSSDCMTFLVLAKLQRVKSPKTVAKAIGLARRGSPKGGPDLHAVFLGGDAFCEEHGRHVSECLPAAVSRAHRGAIHVAAPVAKQCVPAAVQRLTPVAAILASEFETFNLVAHELAALHVPLVVADVVGLTAFFNDTNAYMFRAGDAASLAAALLRATADAVAGRVKRAGVLRYADAMEPYIGVLLPVPGVPPVAGGARRALIDAKEASALWPSSALRQVLRRDIVLAQAEGIDVKNPSAAAASLCGGSS